MRDRNRSRSSSSQESGRSNFKSTAEPSSRLFITGISTGTSEQEIRKMFDNLGNVRDFYFKVPEDPNKKPFAFVEYGSVSEAQKAINAVNGKKIGDKMIYVKFANPRAQKDKQGGGFEKGQNKGQMNREDQGQGYNNRGRSGFGGSKWQKGRENEHGRQFQKGKDFGSREGRYQGSSREEGNGFQKREQRGFGGQGFQGFGGKKEVVAASNEDLDY